MPRFGPFGFAFLVVALGALTAASAAHAGPKEDDLARARVLDQQGVRAYKDGRYNDAVQYFTEAFKLGGPPSELWNLAKCYVKLDDPQEASDTLERYLSQTGLTAQDKSEAGEQLDEIRRRRSVLTVASSPSRATVYLDGNHADAAGTTPFSVPVGPGKHKVEIEQKGYRVFSQDVEAKFGRAIIIDAPLERDPHAPRDALDTRPGVRAPVASTPDGVRRFTFRGEAGTVFTSQGSRAQVVHPGAALGATYWLFVGQNVSLGAGVRFNVTTDGWSNTRNLPNVVPGCTEQISDDQSSAELSGYGVGSFAFRLTRVLRLGADLGLGAATYTANQLGSDLFYPTCSASPGVQIAAHIGVDVSYAVLPAVRILFAPASIQVHPSFDGARPGPIDATGTWLRIGTNLGVAVDL